MGIRPDLAGRQVRCPLCREIVIAPTAAPQAPEPETKRPLRADPGREGPESIFAELEESEDSVFGGAEVHRKPVLPPDDEPQVADQSEMPHDSPPELFEESAPMMDDGNPFANLDSAPPPPRPAPAKPKRLAAPVKPTPRPAEPAPLADSGDPFADLSSAEPVPPPPRPVPVKPARIPQATKPARREVVEEPTLDAGNPFADFASTPPAPAPVPAKAKRAPQPAEPPPEVEAAPSVDDGNPFTDFATEAPPPPAPDRAKSARAPARRSRIEERPSPAIEEALEEPEAETLPRSRAARGKRSTPTASAPAPTWMWIALAGLAGYSLLATALAAWGWMR